MVLLEGIRTELRTAARRAGFSALGALFLVAGLGFLTTALWIALAATQGALTAALVIGALYLGLGFLLLALAARRNPSARKADQFPALMEAFMVGLTAGTANRASTKATTH